MKEIDNFIKYIKDCYDILETDNIGGNSNICRYTRPSMSGYVENAVAILINDILKDKKLNYIIDAQLSVGKSQPLRPDIIIYNENNEILGIVEVKSQLGYAGDFSYVEYNKKIKTIKIAGKKGLLSIKSRNLTFTVSNSCLDCVVIFMSSNHPKVIEKFKKVNHYVLFDDKYVWYDNLSKNHINFGDKGISDFIEYIKKLGN